MPIEGILEQFNKEAYKKLIKETLLKYTLLSSSFQTSEEHEEEAIEISNEWNLMISETIKALRISSNKKDVLNSISDAFYEINSDKTKNNHIMRELTDSQSELLFIKEVLLKML